MMNNADTNRILAAGHSDLDPNEPVLYSRNAIDWFSFLTTPLFGCVMLAVNLKALRRSAGIIPVLSFGIAFFMFAYLATEAAPIVPLIIWNGMGTVYVHYRLWNQYIGETMVFRRRPIWIPLSVAFLMGVVYLTVWFLD